MFPCLKCLKPTVDDDEKDEQGRGEGRHESRTPTTDKEAPKRLTTQLKGIVLRISSGTYKQSKSSTRLSHNAASDKDVPLPHVGVGSSSSTPACDIITTSRGLDSASPSDVMAEEKQQEEWIAEAEEGVNITFLPLPNGGGNELKRIRFSRQKFDRYLSERWWIENHQRIKELYNVQRISLKNTPGRSGAEHQGEGYLSHSNRWDLTHYDSSPSGNTRGNQPFEKLEVEPTASISSCRYELYSLRRSTDTEIEAEWTVQHEPGVFITMEQSTDGTREIRRLRFRKKQFGVEDAEKWWSENKESVEARYL